MHEPPFGECVREVDPSDTAKTRNLKKKKFLQLRNAIQGMDGKAEYSLVTNLKSTDKR